MQFGGELFSNSPKNRWTTPLMYEGRIKYLFSEASRPSGARKSFARASISRFLTVLKVPRCINVRKYDTVQYCTFVLYFVRKYFRTKVRKYFESTNISKVHVRVHVYVYKYESTKVRKYESISQPDRLNILLISVHVQYSTCMYDTEVRKYVKYFISYESTKVSCYLRMNNFEDIFESTFVLPEVLSYFRSPTLYFSGAYEFFKGTSYKVACGCASLHGKRGL